jgi:seryl-tRNA synthetase
VLRKFRDDIHQYDKVLGFEKSVSDLEGKILHLDERYKSDTKCLEEQHAKNVSQLGTEIEKLSKKKANYSSQVNTLLEKHAELEASAKQIEISLIGSLEEMRKASLDSISNVQSSACESIDSAREQSVKKIKEVSERTVSELKDTADSFGAMVSDVSEASEKFGRMDAILPLFGIVNGSESNPTKISVTMISLLDGLLRSPAMQNASNFMRKRIEGTRDEFKMMVKGNAGKR